MNSQIEDIGPCKKKILVTIPAATLAEEMEAGYKEASQYAQVKGFRQGKVPRPILEKKYGEAIRENVKEKVVENAYREALEDHSVEPMGEPKVEGLELEGVDMTKDITFTVTVETFPQVEVKDVKGIEVKKETITVSETEVDQALANLAKGQARLEPTPDGEVEKEDHVKCDLEFFCEGESIKKHEDAHLSPAQPLPGTDPEEYAAKLLSRKAGEETRIPLTYPEKFLDEKYTGKEGEAVITIKEVLRFKEPEVNEDFAKLCGVEGGMEELRQKVEEGVKAQKTDQDKRRREEEITNALLAEHPIELPESMVQQQVEARLKAKREEMEKQGMAPEEIATKVATLRGEFHESDSRAMKKVFILREVAKKEKIYVTEDEIQKAIQAIASEQKVTEGEMREKLEKSNMIPELRFDLMEQKVMDHLMKHATLVEE